VEYFQRAGKSTICSEFVEICYFDYMHLGWLRSYQGISENHALISWYEPRSYFEDVMKNADEIDRLVSVGALENLMESCNWIVIAALDFPWDAQNLWINVGLFHMISFSLHLFLM